MRYADGREPVEIVDVECLELDVAQQPERVAPPVAVAGRPRVLDGAHRKPFLPHASGGQAKKASAALGQRAEEHPHLGDPIAVEPVDEGVARLERLALAAQGGVFPLGGPPVGPDAELLVELDLAVGGLEPRADDLEETAEPRMVARHRVGATEVEHEVVGEDLRQRVVVLAEDRLRHPVDRFDVRVIVVHGVLPRSDRVLGEDRTKRGGAARIGRTNDSRDARLSSSTDRRAGAISMLLPMRRSPRGFVPSAHEPRQGEPDMSPLESTVVDDATAQELSERLADVFRTADVGDVLADDVFLDGHPPLWRFQLQGRDTFAAWLHGYLPDGAETTVVRTIPTVTGFVTEFVGRHEEDGEEITDRKILLCEVRGGRIAELTVYCSGDWDAELRARHAAEAPILRA